MATFDNAAHGVRSASDLIARLRQRSRAAAESAGQAAAVGRGVEGATKLAARGVDDAHLAFREVLHTVAGQDAFRGLTKDAQDSIIAQAAGTNRLLADELRLVQETPAGERVPTLSARDSESLSDDEVLRRVHGIRERLADVAQTYDTQPTPVEMGNRRRLASPSITTTMRDAKTGEVIQHTARTPELEGRTWIERVEDPASGDIQSRTALPEVPGGDLRKVSEVKPSRHASDVRQVLEATVSPSEVHKLLAEVVTAHIGRGADDGLLTPDEVRAVTQHFTAQKALQSKGKAQTASDADQLALSSIAKIVDNAVTRLRGKSNLSETDSSLLERGREWQSRQTLYKPGTDELTGPASLEPRDKSPRRIAQDRSREFLGGGVTSASDSKVRQQSGGEAIVDSDQPTPSQSGRGRGADASKSVRQVLSANQRGRTSLASHLMMEENPDGTLKYPHQALQTALQDVARLEENPNWQSVSSALTQATEYINANRRAAGLQPARFGDEMDKYLAQKVAAADRRTADVASNSASVSDREAYSKKVYNALNGILTGLKQADEKNPVSFDSVVKDDKGVVQYFTFPSQATSDSIRKLASAPKGDPAAAGVGSTLDTSRVPVAPQNVRPKSAPPSVGGKGADDLIRDVAAGRAEPTEAILESVQARQAAIDWKSSVGDKAGAAADQKALDELTAGWDWSGKKAAAPDASSEALPEVPAQIDLKPKRKGRQSKPAAKAPAPAAEAPVPVAPPAPAQQAPAPAPAKPAPKSASKPTDAAPVPPPSEARPTPGLSEEEIAEIRKLDSPEALAEWRKIGGSKPATDADTAAKPQAPSAVGASREQMELAGKQIGMTPEEISGMDDAALYKHLTEKVRSGEAPFKPSDPRFVKRKYSTGVVEEGDNLPDVPSQEVLDAGSRGAMIPYQPKSLPTAQQLVDDFLADQAREAARGSLVDTRRFDPTQDKVSAEIDSVTAARRAADGQEWHMPPQPGKKAPEVEPKPEVKDTVDTPDATPAARASKFGWKENLAATVGVTGAGILALKGRRQEGKKSLDDILGPVYVPDSTQPAVQPPPSAPATAAGSANADILAPSYSGAGQAVAQEGASQTLGPSTAAIEAIKASSQEEEIAARREAVDAALRRIGNIRGMGTYGPAFY